MEQVSVEFVDLFTRLIDRDHPDWKLSRFPRSNFTDPDFNYIIVTNGSDSGTIGNGTAGHANSLGQRDQIWTTSFNAFFLFLLVSSAEK